MFRLFRRGGGGGGGGGIVVGYVCEPVRVGRRDNQPALCIAQTRTTPSECQVLRKPEQWVNSLLMASQHGVQLKALSYAHSSSMMNMCVWCVSVLVVVCVCVCGWVCVCA